MWLATSSALAARCCRGLCPELSARWDDAESALAVDAVGLEVVVIDGLAARTA